MRTLNLGCGVLDKWGTDRLDKENYGQKGVIIFDLNSRKALPFSKNTFKEIRFYETIQLIKYPQEVLEECYRILVPNGLLDIKTLNSDSPYWVLAPLKNNPVKFGKTLHRNSHTLGVFNATMLTDRLESAGFKVLNIYYSEIMDRIIQIKAIK